MIRKLFFSVIIILRGGYDFQLYTIDLEGKILKITYESEFNAFLMFSKDGVKIGFQQIEISRNREKPMFLSQIGEYRRS